MHERTLIVVKPDAVKRALVGKIFQRFEDVGLKLLACKMIRPTREEIDSNYPHTEEWYKGMGEKVLANIKDSELDAMTELGTEDPLKLGRMIGEKIVDYWLEGPVIASVWGGNHAIKVARKIRGFTVPALADAGTILGDYSSDSSTRALKEGRTGRTFIHASGDQDEAKREIEHWFGKDAQLFEDYDRVDHLATFIQNVWNEQ